MTASAAALAHPAQGFDLSHRARTLMLVSGGLIGAASLYALGRVAVGLVPVPSGAKELAVVIHLVTVLPALPIGLYLFAARKGDARHRWLGRVWMALMAITAVAALFIRHLNDGALSFVHIASAVTLIGIPQAILAARRGRIAEHRRHLVQMFTGALVVSGLLSFLPGRLMWFWMFG